MKLLFKGPVIITGKQPARYGVGPCSPGKARKRFPFAVRPKGSHVAGKRGFSCLPLDEPESLPERCRGCFGEPPAHLVDLMHSRFESLIAGAAPEAIMEWAAVGYRLACPPLSAQWDAPCWPAGSGRCVRFIQRRRVPGWKDCGHYAAAKLAGEALYRSLAVELSGRGVTACSLRLSWLDAGRARYFGAQEGGRRKRMPIGRLVRMDEAVETVLFLLSASASSVNGTVVTLDGGLSATKTTF